MMEKRISKNSYTLKTQFPSKQHAKYKSFNYQTLLPMFSCDSLAFIQNFQYLNIDFLVLLYRKLLRNRFTCTFPSSLSLTVSSGGQGSIPWILNPQCVSESPGEPVKLTNDYSNPQRFYLINTGSF